MRGYDVAQHVLSCFGGASGQHACAIAKILGIKTIFIHRYSGKKKVFTSECYVSIHNYFQLFVIHIDIIIRIASIYC